jgi:hypothetical protein
MFPALPKALHVVMHVDEILVLFQYLPLCLCDFKSFPCQVFLLFSAILLTTYCEFPKPANTEYYILYQIIRARRMKT